MNPEVATISSSIVALSALLQGVSVLNHLLFPTNSVVERNKVSRLLIEPLRPDELSQTDWATVLEAADDGSDTSLGQLLSAASKLAAGPAAASSTQRQLHSIFSALGQTTRPLLVVPPVPATLSDAAFPLPTVALPTSNSAELWRLLGQELAQLPRFATAAALADTLLAVWQRLACHLPAPQGLPDVALCDHLASTAALAVCLHRTEAGSAEPILLIGADLSGIQAYLYDIAGTKAAKNLKGRSHYLHLLTETVLKRLLTAFDLPLASVVYASGGGFYVLAPHSAATLEQLDELRRTLGDALFATHQTSLFLALDAAPVTLEQLRGGRVEEPWGLLARKLSRQKARRFAEKIEQEHALFFEPTEVGGEQARDAMTGEELSRGQRTFALERYDADARTESEEAVRQISETTHQQVLLGEQLRRAETSTLTAKALLAKVAVEPSALGLFSWLGPVRELRSLLHNGPTGHVQTFNEPDFLHRLAPSLTAGTALSLGFSYYGGNDFPVSADGHTPKTFDELAGQDNNQVAFKRLGVLRMDVDNLGQVFIKGFAEKQRVFARYTTLSRTLDFFFKGYLNTIWNSSERFRENTFIVYAGGDDLFIVGKWDVVIELASRIRAEFGRYTGQHPALSLSGGVAVVGARFPIAKAAAFADEAEKRAKNHTWQADKNQTRLEKNSFDLLGMPLHWQHEFPLVQRLKEQMTDLLADTQMPRSLLQRIHSLHEQAQTARRTGQPERWRWLMAYDFSRFESRLPNGHSGREFLRKIQEAALTNRYDEFVLPQNQHSFLTLLNLAARWTGLEGRS